MNIITIIAVCHFAIGVSFCWSFTKAVPLSQVMEDEYEYLTPKTKNIIYNLFVLFILFFWFLFIPHFVRALRNKNTS